MMSLKVIGEVLLATVQASLISTFPSPILIIPHRVKFIVGVLALPAAHVPPVVDEAAGVEIRSVDEPAKGE